MLLPATRESMPQNSNKSKHTVPLPTWYAEIYHSDDTDLNYKVDDASYATMWGGGGAATGFKHALQNTCWINKALTMPVLG